MAPIRIAALIAIVAVSSATSCVTSTGIAALLPPGAEADSAANAAFAVAARVAAQHDLQPSAVFEGEEKDGWIGCFTKEVSEGRLSTTLSLCGKIKDHEVQFLLRQIMASRFTPQGDKLRHDLSAALSAEYGAHAVRECEWQNDFNRRRSGCAPITTDEDT